MKLFDTSLLPGKAEFLWIPQDSRFRISVKNCTVWLWTAHCTRTIFPWSIHMNGILRAAARSDGCKVKAAMPSGDCWHSFCSGRAAVLDIPAILFSADLVCTCVSKNACSDVPSDHIGAGD